MGHLPEQADDDREHPDDNAAIAAAARSHGARLVLVPRFQGIPGRAVWLRGARLLATDPRLPVRTLGEHAPPQHRFPESALAHAVFEVHDFVSRRLGHEGRYRDWQEAFGTSNGPAVRAFLEALGGYEGWASAGRLPADPAAVAALVRALDLSPGFAAAIDLWPSIADAALASEAARASELDAAWQRVLAAVPPELRPSAWTEAWERFHRGAPSRARL